MHGSWPRIAVRSTARLMALIALALDPLVILSGVAFGQSQPARALQSAIAIQPALDPPSTPLADSSAPEPSAPEPTAPVADDPAPEPRTASAATPEPAAAESAAIEEPTSADAPLTLEPEAVLRQRAMQAVPTVLAIAALGIGPLLVLLTTGFIRVSIVMALLRQAFGTAQIPSNQVMGAISVLLTVVLMAPVWTEVYREGVEPLLQEGAEAPTRSELAEACQRGVKPMSAFMVRQLEHAGSSEEVWLFWKHSQSTQSLPDSYHELPLSVLLPAFVLSELRTAFLIGFQIYLPFLVIDLLVAATTMSSGLTSIPSQSLAIPLKLVLFVLVDGWRLVVDLLLRSFVM